MALAHFLQQHSHLTLVHDDIKGRRLLLNEAIPSSVTVFTSPILLAVPTGGSSSLCFLCFPASLHPASLAHLCPLSSLHASCDVARLTSVLRSIEQQSGAPQPKLLLLLKALILFHRESSLPSPPPVHESLHALFELSSNVPGCTLDALHALPVSVLSDKRYQRYAAVVDVLLPLLGLPAPLLRLFSRERLVYLVAAFNTNCHRVLYTAESGLEVRGEGVSLLFSLMEHSCDPSMSFRSLVPSPSSGPLSTAVIAARPLLPGFAVSIAYHSAYVRTAMRQRHLRQYYGFDCACDDCVGHDRRRRFCVQHRRDDGEDCEGPVSMRGGRGGREQWSCESCGRPVGEEEYRLCLELERAAMRATSGRDRPHSDQQAAVLEMNGTQRRGVTGAGAAVWMDASHYLLPLTRPRDDTVSVAF